MWLDINEEPGSVVYSRVVVYLGEPIRSRVAVLALLGMNLAAASSAADLAAPRLLRPAANASVIEPITFQWSEVTGAAAYSLQIRNARASAGRVVVSEKVAGPRFTAGALPAQPLWWRVRAVDASGAPGPWSAARRFEPRSPPPAASVFAITLTPPAVSGGSPSEGLVTLTTPAPEGGATVSLATSDTSTATVPHHVVIAAGLKSAAFSVKTAPVPEKRLVRISAESLEATRTVTLTVTPPPPPAQLASLTLNPATLAGGRASQGTVMLTEAAPAPKGVVVQLAADNETLADVPAAVTVSAGQRAATFAVKTARVTLSKSVTITAALGGVTKSAALRLTGSATLGPLAAPALARPAERQRVGHADPVLFGWSGVAGAVSYTIQVDRASTFATEALVTRTVPASEVRVGPFASQAFWWRVRANDAYGVPGRWSPARPFSVD